ncbi:MAG TPA: A/G-specific adenine glycosylase [Bacteroidales bacterium]|nr:A/G-specific adenine glycosylase [Bacteroidales bacterium]
MAFKETLSEWYETHKRNLPWRETRDAYLIWLSEIVLQQTRVNHGLGYYERLRTAYPDVFSLANAHSDDVFKLWEGLGYYNRAAMMLETARMVVDNFAGVFPRETSKLTALKGIGEYTAAAIASFAYNEAVMCVDGNVKRFISRYFGIDELYGTRSFESEIKLSLSKVFDNNSPALFNQAIMEFGALQCKPKPDCLSCPFAAQCSAHQQGKEQLLPVKTAKKPVNTRFFNYIVLLIHNRQTLIKKRLGNDIWKNLFEFPMHETQSPATKNIPWPNEFGIFYQDLQSACIFEAAIHKLTHKHIAAKFYLIHLPELQAHAVPAGYLRVDIDRLHEYAMPRIITKNITFVFQHESQTVLQRSKEFGKN